MWVSCNWAQGKPNQPGAFTLSTDYDEVYVGVYLSTNSTFPSHEFLCVL